MKTFPLLFFLFITGTDTTGELPVARQGVLDLRTWDFGRDGHIRLSGDWKFFPGQFIEPASVEEQDHYLFLYSPGSWNGQPWKDSELSGHGYGTYSLRLLLPQHIKNFGLHVPTFGTAGKVFINGNLRWQAGSVASSAAKSIPRYEQSLCIFNVPDTVTTIDIVVHISNFHYRKGGLWRPFVLGSRDQMVIRDRNDFVAEAFLLGSIIIMGLYHLSLFIFRRNVYFGLYFSLICFITFIRSLFTGRIYILEFLPDISWEIFIKAEFISFFAFILLAILFIHSLYRRETPAWTVWFFTFIPAAFILITLFTPAAVSSHVIPFSQATVLFEGVVCLWILFRAVRNKREGARIFLAGLTFLFIAVINDILYYNNRINTGILIHVGVFIYVFLLSMLISRRFLKAMTNVEKLSGELAAVNRSLESKVKERTKELEEQKLLIENKNQQLLMASEEQNNLMAVVAHDLKAPLNKILGLMNIIKLSGPLTGEQEEMASRINKIADSGRALIADITTFSAFQRDDLKIAIETVRIDEFLKGIIKEHESYALEKGIRLTFSASDESLEANTDSELLKRILDNLLSNAIKFSPRDKQVFVYLARQEKHFSVSIRDEGPGLNPEDKSKLFRKFQKLSAQPTAGELSTGLGLSIVKTLTGKLGGDITVNSIAGQGAEFTVSFPLVVTRQDTAMNPGPDEAQVVQL